MLFFEGTNKEIGHQHGEALREDIATTKEWYVDEWWKDTEENITEQVSGFRHAIEEFAPHLAEEIEGIAEGSNQPVDMVYAINSRTELRPHAGVLECTAVGIKKKISATGSVYLAQNWDWWNSFRELTKLVRIHPTGGPQIATLIEPGQVGKIGMNNHGVGVCLNFLDSLDGVDLHGLPVHILLRLIMEAESFEKAEEVLGNNIIAASANYLIADTRNNIASFEATPNGVWRASRRFDYFVSHANSYNTRGYYCARQKVFDVLVEDKHRKTGSVSFDDLKEIFRHPIIEAPTRDFPMVESIHTIFMDLDAGARELSNGSLSDAYIRYEF